MAQARRERVQAGPGRPSYWEVDVDGWLKRKAQLQWALVKDVVRQKEVAAFG